MRTLLLFWIFILGTPAAVLGAQVFSEKGPLPGGNEKESTLVWKEGDYRDDVWQIQVADDVVSLDISIISAQIDVDLYLLNEPASDLDTAIARSATDVYKESITLSRWEGDRVLESGTYYLHVVGYNSKETAPHPNPSYKIIYRPIKTGSGIPLAWGSPVKTVLRADSGMTQVFKVKVPALQRNWRVDVLSAQMDLNLFGKKERLPLNPGDADFVSDGPLAKESFVYQGDPQSKESLWYLVITGKANRLHSEEFTIQASLGTLPPVRDQPLPRPQWAKTSKERNLSALVELSNSGGRGTGCILSPKGLILTNFHVIRGADGDPTKEVSVALALDPGQPPEELFIASVLETDPERDLALLKVTKTHLGIAVPKDYEFPYFSTITKELPPMGDEVRCAGYPGQGGSGTRTSLTLTRGICAGFEDTDIGRLVKTDAEINYGNSGGAAIDRFDRLFGLPTSIIGEDTGQLGFIHPLGIMDPRWWKTIQKERP